MIIAARRIKSRLQQTVRALRSRKGTHHATFLIACRWQTGYIDNLQLDSSGLVRVEGWCRGSFPGGQSPQLLLNGMAVPLLQHFRFSRSDISSSKSVSELQTGVAWEYLVPDVVASRSLAELRLSDRKVLTVSVPFAITPPHYGELFSATKVWRRHEVYGSGPPNKSLHPEILELAKQLPGPVLDFGCGRGTLVAALQANGTRADGLELDSPILREAISPDLLRHITLYDGNLPSPFENASYHSVVCSEVLEHIADYQAAVADIARIAREQVLITVPDASAIPTGHRHGLVPWHLLEGSHLNFFCQSSLENTLRPHFKRVEFGRVGISPINNTSFYVSLTAHCFK